MNRGGGKTTKPATSRTHDWLLVVESFVACVNFTTRARLHQGQVQRVVVVLLVHRPASPGSTCNVLVLWVVIVLLVTFLASNETSRGRCHKVFDIKKG
jgi:hypothetical protein